MINRALTGVCEISTGTFTVTERPPVYVGENGALVVTVTFKNNGSDADLSGLNANMYLYYPGMSRMTESIDMTTSGSTATGRFVEELTVESGWPLLVIQLVNYDTSELIVACAQPIQITETRGDVVITTRPPTPSEIVYVGRSPYVDPVTHHWMEWDADAGRYADTGISPTGIASITKTGTSGNVDTYTITLSDGSTSTFTVTNGASIASIAKTGTSGLVDTYTITMTDGSTSTFTVTNGNSITNIAKTGTSGLVDTYTITFNDNTTKTFTVTNGRSISSFTKTGTSGLTDTYTITYNDNTTTTINVSNGKGITTIAKTGTSGNVDTYTITYNDGTTSTFTVTNGTGSVTSVNNKTGDVVLTASDVGALPDTYTSPVTSVNGQTGDVTINVPTKTSDLTNDSGFITRLEYTFPYGWCTTAAGTSVKAVNVYPWFTTLTEGQIILVGFAEANTASSPTMNVNSTGAKSIVRYGATFAGTNAGSSWTSGQFVLFRYDGNYWTQLTAPRSTVTSVQCGINNSKITSANNFLYVHKQYRMVTLVGMFRPSYEISIGTMAFTVPAAYLPAGEQLICGYGSGSKFFTLDHSTGQATLSGTATIPANVDCWVTGTWLAANE